VASGAMAVMALVLVTAGCAQATPAARAAISVPVSGGPSWQVVKRVPGLSDLGFSAVVAVGKNGGWAFDTAAKPTAWERTGSNPNAWMQVPFPGLAGETVVCAVATSATNVWAFTSDFGKSRALRWNGTDWNGTVWSRTSVAALLPAEQFLNDSSVTGIFAQSPGSVYAIGSGNLQDEGGPLVILHWNGRQWSKVAGGSYGAGTIQQISSDGHGGFWLPMPGFMGQKTYLLYYSAGHLTAAPLPSGPTRS
jgi:hypothetical protein